MNKMKCFLSKKMLLAVVVLLSVGYVQAQEAKDIVLLTLDKALEIALSENPTMKVAGQESQLKKGGRKINCVMRRFFPSSSVGDRPAPRGCTSTPDERKVTTI